MLEVALPEILDVGVEIRRELVAHIRRRHDLSRSGEGCEPRGQVDPTAVDVALVDDDVADLDAHPEENVPRGRLVQVRAVAHMLDREAGGDRRPHVVELQQHAVPKALDETPAELPDDLRSHPLDDGEPARDEAFLVLLDQANRLDHVDDEHGPAGAQRQLVGESFGIALTSSHGHQTHTRGGGGFSVSKAVNSRFVPPRHDSAAVSPSATTCRW